MPNTAARRYSFLSAKCLPWGVLGLALAILGATIFFASNSLRRKSRAQLLQQDAQIIFALWQSQEFGDEAEGQLGISERTADQLWSVLQTTRLPLKQLTGVFAEHIGTRLFDPSGQLRFADTVSDGFLDPADLKRLRQLLPVARFDPSADLNEINLELRDSPPATGPILEISIPLHFQNQKELLGVAQFVLDGRNIANEFKTLDRNLVVQAVATFLVGGGLLMLVLTLAFRQLLRVNELLTDRTQSLLRANQELALAAKTSAVGAVTAHLIHGLKNPLSGLQSFVASRLSGPDAESEWQLAVSTTRRMQNMISEIVQVLRDEQGESSYELSLTEFVQMLEAKVRPLAAQSGISFSTELFASSNLTNREANLISLILYNLIQNAVQASPVGKQVVLRVKEAGKLVFEVSDQGPGLTLDQQKSLFQPCRSAKEGGSGIGLAISKQLASCLEAELELKESGPAGSVFVLAYSARTRAGQGTATPQVTLT